MRDFLLAILTFGFLGAIVLIVWGDHVTSGIISKRHGAFNTLLATSIFFFWSWVEIPRATPILAIMAVTTIVMGFQYLWYVGFLSPIRRRHVLKLRQKWEKELAWLDQHRETLTREAVALTDCSSTTRDPWSKQNAWVVEQDDRRRRKLEWKLRNITL